MNVRLAFLVGFSIGVMALGLWGGSEAAKAMVTVLTVVIVGGAVRALIRTWWPRA